MLLKALNISSSKVHNVREPGEISVRRKGRKLDAVIFDPQTALH